MIDGLKLTVSGEELRRLYRLAAGDLQFGELLPDKPGWLAQEDEDQRSGLRFVLERLVKTLDGVVAMGYGLGRHDMRPTA